LKSAAAARVEVATAIGDENGNTRVVSPTAATTSASASAPSAETIAGDASREMAGCTSRNLRS
jgi:hypothetical protein